MPWTVPCKQWLNTESSTDRISWSQTYNFQEGDISGIYVLAFWLSQCFLSEATSVCAWQAINHLWFILVSIFIRFVKHNCHSVETKHCTGHFCIFKSCCTTSYIKSQFKLQFHMPCSWWKIMPINP